ncbi:MAG: M20/M25/M40 family metallo-hydrolase [Parvularculaceae bacterium]
MARTILSISALGAAVTLAASAVAAEDAKVAPTPAQAQTVERLIDRALADDTAYDFVEDLTTEVGPRLAATEAEARARDWAAAKLKSLGFKNVRIETFEMPSWERRKEEASIAAPFAQPLTIAALGRSIATPAEGITAPVVRFPTLQALIDAPMTGLEGKIVFVDEKMTRTQDGSGYGAAVKKRSGAAEEAGKRGAAAAIIRSVGTDWRRNPHTGGMNYKDGVAKVPTAALSNPDADQLARALERAPGKVSVSLNIQVETKAVAVSGNVIGEIPGQTDEIILVGGHLDSWDLGTGAIDDGAGVAITAAAAKLVGDLPGKPKRTIRVVFFGAEEVGLFGAKAYAAAHKDELSRHVIAAESDFGAGRIWKLDTNVGASALAKTAAIANVLRRLGVDPGANNSSGGPDVGELKKAGVPVADLSQDGWDYFDYHHTPDDTFDKIDPEALRQNVAAYAATIYLASELPGGFRDPAGASPSDSVSN